MKNGFSGLFAALLLCGAAGAGEIVLEENFNDPAAATKLWGKMSGITFLENGGPDGSGCLKAFSDNRTPVLATRLLDLEKVRGRKVTVTVLIKGENVQKPPESYLGPKAMIYVMKDGKGTWHEHSGRLFGTHDWKQFQVVADIPQDATKVELQFGIQGAPGTVYFDNIKAVVE